MSEDAIVESEQLGMGVWRADSADRVLLYGPDEHHMSWAGQGWMKLGRAELEWWRDTGIPAALAHLESPALTRPSGESGTGEWSCANCGFRNSGWERDCRRCGRDRAGA